MQHQIETSLKDILEQLHKLLTQLSDEDYARPLSILSDSSIGQHTRHIIEFFQTLAGSYHTGVVNYDKRKRNKLLESDCTLARHEIDVINKSLSKEDKKILLVGSYSHDGDEESTVESSYYRELVYNLEHTVHHMAIIKIAIRNATVLHVPDEFGVAAATIKNKQRLTQVTLECRTS